MGDEQSLVKKSNTFLRKSSIQQMKTQNLKSTSEYPLLGNGTVAPTVIPYMNTSFIAHEKT